jgi:Cu/Ag efflux pump CusA
LNHNYYVQKVLPDFITFQQFTTNRKEGAVDESLVYAISTRLWPKLMTALGAIIALVPLAAGLGTGAQMHQPLAIAVIGGFIMALPLLPVIFPTLLHLLYGMEDKSKYQIFNKNETNH